MARRTLTSQIREVADEMRLIVISLAQVTTGAEYELVLEMSRKVGKLNGLCGVDRVERGLPYDEDEPRTLADIDERGPADTAAAAVPSQRRGARS